MSALRRIAAGALLASLLAAAANAAFEDLGAGARAPGMGGAFTAVADDAYAVFYNPSGLAQLERPQLSLSYSRLYLGLSDKSDLSYSNGIYAHPLPKLHGTAAFAWQRFSLAGLYEESTYLLSYGGKAELSRGTLFSGANLKLLEHSFSRNDDAVHAKDGNGNVVGSDDVLTGRRTACAPDLDLGLLYRFRGRFSLGLDIQHVFEPNVAFSSTDADRAARAYRIALGYKSAWMNLASEVKLDRAPDGGIAKEFDLGAERYFQSLTFGQLGLRAGMSVGNYDFRQLSAGMTYRINKVQIDYAFIIPLGGVPGVTGTHRMGFTFHFGAPTVEEEYTANLARLIREGPRVEGYAYEFEGLTAKKMTVLNNVTLSTATALIRAGQYEKAYGEVSDIVSRRATKVEVVALARRLEELTTYYPSLDVAANPWAKLLGESCEDFLGGDDRAAMLLASQAWSLFPTETLGRWLTRLEQITEVKAQRVPQGSNLSLLDMKLRDSEGLFLGNRLGEARTLLEEALIIHPSHPIALSRLGSVLYAENRYRDAVSMWQKALEAGQTASETQNIRYMIGQAEKRLAPKTPAKEASQIETEANPQLLRRLYQYAVELYSSGKKAKAAEVFQKLLQLDPKNTPARKALNRIEKELLLGQQEGGL